MIPKSKDYIEYPYLGPQGETCRTGEDLRVAQENYRDTFTFIGPQGETCRILRDLEVAIEAHKKTFSRKEIPVINLDNHILIKVISDLR